jgi:hypothetical protein
MPYHTLLPRSKIHLPSNKSIMEPTNNGEGALTEEQKFDRAFKPKGAIAFFILMVILGMIIWYGIYFLMLDRA